MQNMLLLVMMTLTAHVLMIAKDATTETETLVNDGQVSVLAEAQKYTVVAVTLAPRGV